MKLKDLIEQMPETLDEINAQLNYVNTLANTHHLVPASVMDHNGTPVSTGAIDNQGESFDRHYRSKEITKGV